MHGDCCHISTCIHGRNWKFISEMQMRSMGFIY